MENKAVFYVHFDIFIFENKEAGKKIQLDGQFARCPAVVECPAYKIRIISEESNICPLKVFHTFMV